MRRDVIQGCYLLLLFYVMLVLSAQAQDSWWMFMMRNVIKVYVALNFV